jgi:hypothetical protein
MEVLFEKSLKKVASVSEKAKRLNLFCTTVFVKSHIKL